MVFGPLERLLGRFRNSSNTSISRSGRKRRKKRKTSKDVTVEENVLSEAITQNAQEDQGKYTYER